MSPKGWRGDPFRRISRIFCKLATNHRSRPMADQPCSKIPGPDFGWGTRVWCFVCPLIACFCTLLRLGYDWILLSSDKLHVNFLFWNSASHSPLVLFDTFVSILLCPALQGVGLCFVHYAPCRRIVAQWVARLQGPNEISIVVFFSFSIFSYSPKWCIGWGADGSGAAVSSHGCRIQSQLSILHSEIPRGAPMHFWRVCEWKKLTPSYWLNTNLGP